MSNGALRGEVESIIPYTSGRFFVDTTSPWKGITLHPRTNLSAC